MSEIEDPIVVLRGVGKVYEPSPPWMRFLVRTAISREIVALDGVDLELRPGHICAVVGPNGAGKSTVFRILTGLTTPTSGTATVAGLDAEHQAEEVRRLLGWMPAEDRSLFMRLSCKENLYFHGRLQGIPPRQLRTQIPAVLDKVGLGTRIDSNVFSLSAGMRARLQLARALLHHPRVLILDEPTAAVDPVGAHELLSLIMEYVSEHRLACLISSHRLEEIEALRAHVILLDKGKVRYQGDLDELRRQWGRPQVEIAFGTALHAQEAAAALALLVAAVQVRGAHVQLSLPMGLNVGDLLGRLGTLTTRIVRISERPIPLRDLLAHIYNARSLLVGSSP